MKVQISKECSGLFIFTFDYIRHLHHFLEFLLLCSVNFGKLLSTSTSLLPLLEIGSNDTTHTGLWILVSLF